MYITIIYLTLNFPKVGDIIWIDASKVFRKSYNFIQITQDVQNVHKNLTLARMYKFFYDIWGLNKKRNIIMRIIYRCVQICRKCLQESSWC